MVMGYEKMHKMYFSRDISVLKAALKRCLADHESRWIHGPRLLGILEELEVSKEQVDEALEKYREELLEKILRKKD